MFGMPAKCYYWLFRVRYVVIDKSPGFARVDASCRCAMDDLVETNKPRQLKGLDEGTSLTSAGIGIGVRNLSLRTARLPKVAECGQSLLEFALMLPFLMLLFLGVVELGRAAFITIAVTNAATAGAEYGSTNSATAGDIAGMKAAASVDADYTGMTFTSPTPTYGCICDNGSGVSCTNPVPAPGTCASIASSCTGTSQIVECVQVSTTATFSSLFHYPGLPASFQTNGNAIMRVRR
jgi:Flp pilus assembly protein TadG